MLHNSPQRMPQVAPASSVVGLSRTSAAQETGAMLKHWLRFTTKRRRLLAGAGIGFAAIVLGVVTARTFVYFAQPHLDPGPLWVPFVVRIPLGMVLAWGTYRLLTTQAESYWQQMTTQDAVRNACQMLLNAAQVRGNLEAQVQIEDAVSRIQKVLSADPATKRANARVKKKSAKAG
jgi:hypothetical protein